jgi:hypothetical protein
MQGKVKAEDVLMVSALKMTTKKKTYMGINPKHEGYCTPMSKPTCTPRRKALAKRLKPGGDLYKEKTMKKKQQGGQLKQLNDMQYARRGKTVGSMLEGGKIEYASGGPGPVYGFRTSQCARSSADRRHGEPEHAGGQHPARRERVEARIRRSTARPALPR